MRRGGCGRRASSLRPAAGLEVAQAAQPSGWGCGTLASFAQAQIDNVGGEPLSELGQGIQFGLVKVLKRRLDGPAAGGDDLPRGGSPGRRQGESDRASVIRGRLAGDMTIGHQAVDQTHGRRVRKPEDTPQSLDRAPARELMQGHERRRGLAAATGGCLGCPNDAV